ncbi:Something about silencing, SAS, complex subunit 4 domain containing protein [Rhypophila decipiens]
MAMTTSMTRSRRAEGPRHPTHSPIRSKIIAISPNANLNGATKRGYDQIDHEINHIVTKRPKFTTSIAVEIPAPRLDARHKPVTTKPTSHTHHQNPSRATQPAATKATPPSEPKPARTKHQEKVANGLKHELNRLQSSLPADVKSEGRKLRSQEQSRFKSELSTYFPDYDEVIGNEPEEKHLISVDTPILIVPSSGAASTHQPTQTPDEQSGVQPPATDQVYPIRGYDDHLFADLYDSQKIDFSFLESQIHRKKSQKDPLPDSVFEPWHKKEERAERSARNTEKGRAQHEKEQIIRLLEGLQSHDWLRVMGVSGITESKKKTFEPARDHFIRGCQTILGKFRRWAAEEKRRKREKDRAQAEAEARKKAAEQEEPEEADAEEEEEPQIDEEEEEDEEIPDSDGEIDDDEQDEKADDSDGDPPDYDVDASIAKQLREEAIAAATKKTRSRRSNTSPQPIPQDEPEFKSFFKKPHERVQALNKSRRRGRTAKAWGEPVPDVRPAEFELPEELEVDNREFQMWWGREKRNRKRRKS